jgi:hypothetical protein
LFNNKEAFRFSINRKYNLKLKENTLNETHSSNLFVEGNQPEVENTLQKMVLNPTVTESIEARIESSENNLEISEGPSCLDQVDKIMDEDNNKQIVKDNSNSLLEHFASSNNPTTMQEEEVIADKLIKDNSETIIENSAGSNQTVTAEEDETPQKMVIDISRIEEKSDSSDNLTQDVATVPEIADDNLETIIENPVRSNQPVITNEDEPAAQSMDIENSSVTIEQPQLTLQQLVTENSEMIVENSTGSDQLVTTEEEESSREKINKEDSETVFEKSHDTAQEIISEEDATEVLKTPIIDKPANLNINLIKENTPDTLAEETSSVLNSKDKFSGDSSDSTLENYLKVKLNKNLSNLSQTKSSSKTKESTLRKKVILKSRDTANAKENTNVVDSSASSQYESLMMNSIQDVVENLNLNNGMKNKKSNSKLFSPNKIASSKNSKVVKKNAKAFDVDDEAFGVNSPQSTLSTEGSSTINQAAINVYEFDSSSNDQKPTSSKRKLNQALTKKTNVSKKRKIYSKSTKQSKSANTLKKRDAESSNYEDEDEYEENTDTDNENFINNKTKPLKNTDFIKISNVTQDLYTTDSFDINSELSKYNIKKCAVRIKRLDQKQVEQLAGKQPLVIGYNGGADDVASVVSGSIGGTDEVSVHSDASSRSSHRRVRKSTGGRSPNQSKLNNFKPKSEPPKETSKTSKSSNGDKRSSTKTLAKATTSKTLSNHSNDDKYNWDSDELPDININYSNENENPKINDENNATNNSNFSLNMHKNQINS